MTNDPGACDEIRKSSLAMN